MDIVPTIDPSPQFNPYAVLNLTMRELASSGVKSRFTGLELHEARSAADQLLLALGVTPVIDDRDEYDREDPVDGSSLPEGVEGFRPGGG